MNEWSFLIQHGRIQDACHHQVEWEWISLSQIKLVWVRVRVEWECFWVNLGEENKESESNMLEFKMAVIIKLSQNEWVKVFFVQMVGTNLGKCEWDWEEKLRWLNPRWWNSRWLPSSSWMRMNEFESHWISLSQSQSGVRVFLSEFERRKQGVWIQDGSVWIQHGGIQGGCHHQVESEWMSEGFFVQMVGTHLGKCEWVWEKKLRWLNPRWRNSRWQKSRWLPSSSWVRMKKFESD